MHIEIDVGFSGYVRGNYEINKEEMLKDMYKDIEDTGEYLKGDTLKDKVKFWIERNYFRYLGAKDIVRDDTESYVYVELADD